MAKSTCSVDGCDSPLRTIKSGLCEKHYYRNRRWGDPNVVRKIAKYEDGVACSAAQCDRAVFSLGLCSRHYAKYRKYGNAEHPPQPRGPQPKPPKVCSVDECDAGSVARGLCRNHYVQERRRSSDPTVRAIFSGRVSRGNYRRRAVTDAAEMMTVTAGDWVRLVARYRGCCAYCGDSAKRLTLEHIIPLARGGRHSIGNILPACGSCNSSKRDLLLVEWRAKKLALVA